MIDMNKIKEELKNSLSHKRYIHSLGVEETAIKLARIYNESIEKASIAGLIHDLAKDFSNVELLHYAKDFDILHNDIFSFHPSLLHGMVGAELAKRKFHIKDEEILDAIRFHTTGKRDMSILEKIIYLADYIEPNRSFPKVEELRKVAFLNLDEGVLKALDHTIHYIVQKGELLHPDTIHARNFLLLQRKSF